MSDTRAFAPAWVSPPGDTIADFLRERGWSAREFARQTGFAMTYVRAVMRGDAVITHQVAERLAAVLGSTTEFWLAREDRYQSSVERLRGQVVRLAVDAVAQGSASERGANDAGDASE